MKEENRVKDARTLSLVESTVNECFQLFLEYPLQLALKRVK